MEPLSLHDLTFPLPQSNTLERVLARADRHWVTQYLALARMRPPGALGELHGRVMALAKELSSTSPARLASLVREPTQNALVGAILRHARPGGQRAKVAGWLVELHLNTLLHLATVMAEGADSPSWTVDVNRDAVPRGWPVLRSLLANVEVRIPEDAHGIRFQPGKLSVIGNEGEGIDIALGPHIVNGGDGDAGSFSRRDDGGSTARAVESDRPFWARTPYHHIADGIHLATTDNNPLVDVQNHPEREGNPLDLADRAPQEWVGALREAHQLIADHLPELAREMRQLLRLIVPVGWDPERHSSASYEEAVGAVYLTLHPSPMTLAEALIHEFQHNKLYAVLAFDPLLLDGPKASFTSPLRPDPRPLRGVLFAVHAFQPVARLYEVMTQTGHPLSKGRDWGKRMAEILRINREGAQTLLENARPTALARALFDEMQSLEKHFEGWSEP